ncbi:MAG: tetratricopeptide repeat protein [Gallionella sp.]
MWTRLTSPLWAGMLVFGLAAEVALATPEEDVAKANQLFEEADFKESTRLYLQAADQNYLPAQVHLGEMLMGGTEYNEAFGWFLTAAFQGDAAGQFNVGQMYLNGFGVEASPSKAFYWIKKAAEQDYLDAVRLLAASYRPVTEKSVEGQIDKGKSVEAEPQLKNALGIERNQEQADFWAAKLPALEKEARRLLKKVRDANEKKRAEEAEKAKEAQSKLLCGLKC